jgi:tryptophan 2,3-dioxygenase
MDTLTSLQHPRTDADTEPGFIILSQVKELLFKLLHTEFSTARDYLRDDRLQDALWTLRRSARVQQVLLSCWEALSALTPGEFASFRSVLGNASGFQSFSYRRLEFLLGNKDPALVRPHRRTSQHRSVLEQLHQPSLYDAVLCYLSRHGLDIPQPVLDRDFAQPYQPQQAVLDAWLTVYRQPERYRDLFLLGEALTDTAYLFGRWRYTHLLTVERLLGSKPGTGGTTGVPWLGTIAGHRFFPELWSMRSAL